MHDNNSPPATGFRHRPSRWLLVGLPAVFFVIALLSTYYNERTLEQQKGFKVPERGTVTHQEVKLTAWLDKTHLKADATATVWVTIENLGQETVERLRFSEFNTTNLKKAGSCWRNGAPACRAGGERGDGWLDRLGSGEELTVSASLMATEGAAGRVPIAMILSWRDGEARVRQSGLILPGISVSPGILGAVLYRFLRDFTLPIALLFVPLIVNLYRQRQEDQQRTIDQELAAFRETWNLMLPKFHQNSEKHYMPVSSRLMRLRQSIEKDGAENCPPRSESLYWLLSVFRRLEELTTQIGGLYFKDRLGEQLAQSCWFFFRHAAEKRLHLLEMSHVVPALGLHETYHRFLERWQAGHQDTAVGDRLLSQNIQRIYDNFVQQWPVEEFKRDLIPLEILERILDYEMNRPYTRWYGEPEEFPHEDLQDLMNKVQTLACFEDERFKGWKKDLNEYIRRNKTSEDSGT